MTISADVTINNKSTQMELVRDVLRISLREVLYRWPGQHKERIPPQIYHEWELLAKNSLDELPKSLTVSEAWAAMNAIHATINFLGPEELETICGRPLGDFLNASRIVFAQTTGFYAVQFWEQRPC